MTRTSDPFQEMFEALRDTANALIIANTSLKRMADAALGIHADYQDAREQTQRLESQNARLEELILQLQADVRDLRQRLNGGSH